MQKPQTPQEWQEVVDVADFLLTLYSCHFYGLLDRIPIVNVKACEDVLAQGRSLGYLPAPISELVEKYVEKP